MDNLQIFGLVWFFVIVGLNAWFLAYLIKLEKSDCECALTWRRYYLIAYIAFNLFTNMLLLVFPGIFKNQFVAAFAPILPILSILFIVFAIQYVSYLKESKCECSEAMAREVLNIYAWINVAVICIAVVQSFIYIYYMWRFTKATNALALTMTPKKISRK